MASCDGASPGIGFSTKPFTEAKRTIIAVDIKNAVTVRVFSRHFLDRDDIAAGLFVDINELP